MTSLFPYTLEKHGVRQDAGQSWVPDLAGLQACYDLVWVGVTLGHPCLQVFCFAMGWPWAPLMAVWALGIMGATALRIGAFNVQSFGDHKASDPDCGSVIAQVRPSGVGTGWRQWRVGGRGRSWEVGGDGDRELGSGQLGSGTVHPWVLPPDSGWL